jgi:hypothetical protein
MDEHRPVKPRYPLAFPPDEASSWRRIRRYAVPRRMIEQATARRLAGDWGGACAAAHVGCTVDLAEVAAGSGAETAARLADDLRHLAPDLVRWHLPRYLRGRTTLRPGQRVLLASYGAPGDGPHLYVTSVKMIDGPQRLTLLFGKLGQRDGRSLEQVQDWRLARHLWDARRVSELLDRCGGGTRPPFRNADGSPRGAAELPADDPGPGDPAGYTEWVTMLADRGATDRACRAAEITVDPAEPKFGYYTPPPLIQVLAAYPLALTRLEPEIRLLDAAGRGGRFRLPYQRGTAITFELDARRGLFDVGRSRSGLLIKMVNLKEATGVPLLPEACWRRLPDLDLLRFGDIDPGELHPLVSAGLFPARALRTTDGPSGPGGRPPAATRVRCRGEWHEVRPLDGGIRTQHTAEEERRERAMRALGGPVTGCFAVQQAWTSGTGWLPKALRAQRREFFSLVQHGETTEVLRLLDAGTDPFIRDGRQRTLLHLLHLVDHEAVLPRLLAAGLDLEARDHHHRTPLHVAVGEGPVALVQALLDAGARTDVLDDSNRALPFLILQHRRKELRSLYDAVLRDYPKLADNFGISWEDLDDWEEQDD